MPALPGAPGVLKRTAGAGHLFFGKQLVGMADLHLSHMNPEIAVNMVRNVCR